MNVSEITLVKLSDFAESGRRGLKHHAERLESVKLGTRISTTSH